ncbi:MAG: RNA polymerase sigma factor [Chloroflexota bacterium]
MSRHETPQAGPTAETALARALAADLDGTFERLVMEQQDRLYTIALRMLGDARDAEEAAQDAFVRAYRALAGYDAARTRELRLRGWLTTILLNVCRNRVRRPGPTLVAIDRRGTSDEAAPADHLASTDATASPHDSALRRETSLRWARLVTGLPPLYRAAVVLRHVDGLSYAEMSAALGKPEGTLKAQVHRGLSMLRAAAEQSDEIIHPTTTRTTAQELSA